MFRIALLATALFPPGPVAAQAPDTLPPSLPRLGGLTTLGSPAEDRLRVRQLLSGSSPDGFLLRSASSLSAFPGGGDRFEWSIVAPEVALVQNSGIPFTFNDGALWAGRGTNTRVLAGARLRYGPLSVVLAPQVVRAENRDFQTIPYPESREPRRSTFASPFHYPPESLDLPLRFGDEPVTFVDAGQSSLTVTSGPVAFGAATENLWWGPGVRNALVMSNNAAGIPHLFLRTAAPLNTPLGTVEGRWILGRLRESEYFDLDPDNDVRSMSAFALTLRPPFEPNLSLGLARAVVAPAEDGWVHPLAALDAFRSVGRPNSAPGDSLVDPGPDQILSLFGRWILPESGFEVYGEWGRYEQPASLRDLLEMPNHSQAYTLGVQWAREVSTWGATRLQAEWTNLEPSTSYRVRPVHDWYSSRAVPQGYTQRGQVIGASIGPGASGQWIAADVLGGRWQLGTFFGRVRWDNHVFFTTLDAFRMADVSIFAGLRGGFRLGPAEVSGELSTGSRLNYLFQDRFLADDVYEGVDLRNHSLAIRVGFHLGGAATRNRGT